MLTPHGCRFMVLARLRAIMTVSFMSVPMFALNVLLLRLAFFLAGTFPLFVGCLGGGETKAPRRLAGVVEKVVGKRGLADGRFQKPRAMVIDQEDNVFIIDMTARIQVFDRDGNFLRSWRTPAWELGRPTGISTDRQGNLMVADTHYHRILFYTPQGEPLPERTLGGKYGNQPGEFGLVTDVVQDQAENYYISEYGELDRIQLLDKDGKFVTQWGGHGNQPGEFLRPQSIALDEEENLWVADACNHRIQVFDTRSRPPKYKFMFGEQGTLPGQLRYPYGLRLAFPNCVLVSEFGNHRIQVFTRDGKSLGIWGTAGRQPGQLDSPWALDLDQKGAVHILDSLNHRWQRIGIRDLSLRLSP